MNPGEVSEIYCTISFNERGGFTSLGEHQKKQKRKVFMQWKWLVKNIKFSTKNPEGIESFIQKHAGFAIKWKKKSLMVGINVVIRNIQFLSHKDGNTNGCMQNVKDL